VITIDVARCTGCGTCIDICPTGALYLVEGKAVLDAVLCHECEACIDICATGAIALAPQPEPAAEPATSPSRLPAPGAIRVRTQPAPVPFRAKALPVAGAALAWAGRAILPRLADFLLDALDRRMTAPQTTGAREASGRASPGGRGRGSGRQHRHRRRGR
jgi:NAD-dependent dihydropyrimidine dehydrogenase PreA subunit